MLRASITPTVVHRGRSASVEAKLSHSGIESPVTSDASGASDFDALSEEARDLKALLLRKRPRLHRFSLSCMRKMVVPPVEIPHPLDVPGGLACLVSGVKIPMTLDMSRRHRKKLLRRLPATVNERSVSAYYM